jgi:uroporphyrinogen-III synthase
MSFTALITRPKPQALNLATALHKIDFKTIIFPTLALIPPPNPEQVQQLISNIHDFDWLIFVSPNAVQFFLTALGHTSITLADLITFKIAAIGRGTTQELEKIGFQAILFPETANSQHLLELAALQQVENRKILIFAGINGNDLLAKTLSERGAQVTMAYTHQNLTPNYIKNDLNWQPHDIDITLSTSLASLRNLRTILQDCGYLALLKKPLLVISPSMVVTARELGFTGKIIETAGAANDTILNALQDWGN